MNIRRIRHLIEMSQTDLAKAIGVSRQALSQAEFGKVKSTVIEDKVRDYIKKEGHNIESQANEDDLRTIYADLKTALMVVKSAMDKVERCL